MESVMDATTRILTSMGTEAATTNRVAEIAGVSIGSLYQYFPNKDAIMASLIERHLSDRKKSIIQILEENKTAPADVVIEKVITNIVQMFIGNKIFLKALFTNLPRLDKTRDLLFVRNEITETLVEFFESRSDGIQIKNVRAAFFVVTSAVMGVVQTSIFTEDLNFDEETLKQELIRLVTRYLLGAL